MILFKKQPISYFWLAFSLIAILEFVLFKSYVLQNITGLYPASYDQTSYLPVSYSTYENIKQSGLLQGLQNSQKLATGFLFPIQAALLYLLFGASRLTALLPNLIYFIALQVCSLVALRSISSKNYLSFILVGLILLLQAPFLGAGGLFDFRIDFIAYCLYGMILGTCVKSSFFEDHKWSIITALLSALLILLRGITLVYLLAIFGLMFSYLLFIQKDKKRSLNLFIVTLLITTVSLIYIWTYKNALYNYYMVGHLIGAEKNIRAIEVGVTDFVSLILFYPTSLLVDHIGYLCLGFICAIGLFFCLRPMSITISDQITFILQPVFLSSRKGKTNPVNPLWKIGYVFFLLCLLIPLAALTLDLNKSFVVGSIMVIPFIWLVIWSYLYLDSTYEKNRFVTYLVYSLSLITLLLGVLNQFIHLHHHFSKKHHKDIYTITEMYQDIGHYAVAKNWPEIYLSVDQINDYLTSGGIRTIYYETTGKLLTVGIERLGSAIFAVNQTDALSSLRQSNVVILNLNDYADHSPYPFNQSVNALKPFIKKYADAHFTRLGDYHFMDSTYRVYVR